MHNVAIVTPLFPSEEKPYYCIYLYQQLRQLQMLGYGVTVIQPTAALNNGTVQNGEFRGIKVISVGLRSNRMLSLANILPDRFCRAMAALLQQGHYDLVSLNLTSNTIEHAVIRLCRKQSIKVVVHFHGLDICHNHHIQHKKIIALLNNHQAKHNLKRMDGAIGVSNKVCDQIKKVFPVHQLYTVYNGADDQMFFPTPAEKPLDAPFYILCVANLIPLKGHSYLLDAVRKLRAERPAQKIIVKFIGVGPVETELKQQAEGLPVEFMGAQDYPIVAQEMRKADFYIMPSYYEAIGCVYLEAMLSGTAALGVRGCGIDEVIEDRVNGYLVSPQNSDEIADCIRFAIDNPEKHSQIAKRGYETVRDHFTWQDSAKALDAAYQRILKGNKR